MKRLTSLLLVVTMTVGMISVNSTKVSATENEQSGNVQYEIYPLPQSEVYGDSSFVISDEVNVVIEKEIDESTRNFINEILKIKDIKKIEGNEVRDDKTNLIIGVKDSEGYVDKYFDENIKYNEAIFSEEDPYVLKIDGDLEEKGTIAILAETTDSAYYGLATLKMIFNQIEGKEVEDVVYEDFADAKWRGFIEGFYGFPWSNEDRKSLMEFGGNFKMNSYIFAPKDDPYHNRQWRVLYPEKELAEIKELVDVGHKSKTQFVWAIHPGFNMINWNDYDNELATLLAKLEQLYKIGVRQFGLFMDDISTDQSLADTDKHVKLVTDVAKWVEGKKDCYSLVYCPPYYNQAWTGEKGKPYLRALASVPENVEIMWTGVDVCGAVVESEMQWPKDLVGRDTYVWLNWPVNGHKPTRLMLGKGEMLNPGVHNISGIVTNPLEYAELSKTSIFAIADYTWNTDNFDEDKSWEDSFKYINPEVAEEFHIIASHLSDPSPTGRNLVFEESEYLKEDLELFLANYDSGDYIEEVGLRLVNEFDKILEAIKVFDSEKNLNENMKKEIDPWLNSLEYIVKSCRATVNSAMALRKSDMNTAWSELANATSYKQISQSFTTPKLNSNDIVVESGSKRLIPFANKLIDKLDSKVYMDMDPQASSRMPMASYNSTQLNLMVDGNEETYAYFQVRQKVDDWYGVDLGKVINVSDIEIVQGRNDNDHDRFHKGILEYSTDGKTWAPIGEERTGVRISETNLNVEARYIRYRAIISGVPGGKPDLWTAVREITINKGENEVTLYTNIENLNNININTEALSTKIVDLSNVTLKANEYLGFKLTGIEKLTDITCNASSTDITLQVSPNGVEWTEVPESKVAEARYVRVINKTNNEITFNLNELSVKINKFEESEITHNYGSIHSGSLENAFDKELGNKVWFGSAQQQGKYIQIDLGGVVDINKVSLVIGDSEKDFFRNGNLEVSLDGKAWEVIDTINGGTREANFPTFVAPYRYRNIENINKQGRYVRLISTTNNNAWFAINEILINDGNFGDLTGNPALTAKPEGVLNNTSEAIIDKKLATFYTPQGDTTEGELLYKLSDYTEVKELIILQSPAGISNAVVEVRDLNGWHEVGTLSNSYNSFDTSSFQNVLDVKLTWNEAKPIINEIITVKRSGESISPEEKPDVKPEEKPDVKPESISFSAAILKNNVVVGENFNVNISLDDLTSKDMYSMEFEVEYDKEKIEFVDVVSCDNEKYVVNYKEANGKLNVIVAGLGINFENNKDIVSLEFKAVSQSENANINITAGQVANGDGQVVEVENATVAVKINENIDKTGLSEVIENAKELAENKDNKYTEASINALKAAIATAEGVVNNKEATQEQVNVAKDALQNAIDSLKLVDEPAITVDKIVLQGLVNRVKDTDESKYIASTWSAFEEALQNANNILSKENSTQEEVDSSYNSLLRAYLGLRLTPDKSALEDLINKANSLDLSKYTKASVKNFNAELKKANEVFNNEEATKAQIEEATNNLSAAMANLEEKSVASSNNESSNSSSANNNTNTSGESNNSNKGNKLPNTGATASSALALVLGATLAGLGSVITKKRK